MVDHPRGWVHPWCGGSYEPSEALQCTPAEAMKVMRAQTATEIRCIISSGTTRSTFKIDLGLRHRAEEFDGENIGTIGARGLEIGICMSG